MVESKHNMCMLSIDHEDATQPNMMHSIQREREISQYTLLNLSLFASKDNKTKNHLNE